jgi:3-deoxy-D-manno-octulosonic-acid transferase
VIETGNLKIDAALCALQKQPLPIALPHWPQTVHILLGASTWPGEEAWLLEFFLNARKSFSDLRLVLVPRHAERRKEIKHLLQPYPLRFDFRSMQQSIENPDVYVVDTTGELQSFLQIADWVFIGRSLPPNRGGQTPIEAAAYGKPMVYGSHMENFETICKSLEAANVAVRCADKERVGECLLRWMRQPNIAKCYGQSAQQWVEAHKGATRAVFKALLEALNRSAV